MYCRIRNDAIQARIRDVRTSYIFYYFNVTRQTAANSDSEQVSRNLWLRWMYVAFIHKIEKSRWSRVNPSFDRFCMNTRWTITIFVMTLILFKFVIANCYAHFLALHVDRTV